MKSLCLLAAFSLPPAFFGCLNSPMVHTSLNGPTSAGQPLATKLIQIIERPAMANRPRLTDRANPQDRAVSAILSGDYSGGIAILQELETTQPGQYQTAANLGTAFELAGDNSQALTGSRRACEETRSRIKAPNGYTYAFSRPSWLPIRARPYRSPSA